MSYLRVERTITKAMTAISDCDSSYEESPALKSHSRGDSGNAAYGLKGVGEPKHQALKLADVLGVVGSKRRCQRGRCVRSTRRCWWADERREPLLKRACLVGYEVTQFPSGDRDVDGDGVEVAIPMPAPAGQNCVRQGSDKEQRTG
jgi:hypothetical protein